MNPTNQPNQRETQPTSAAHTPGPWRIRRDSISFATGVYGPSIHGQDSNWIADTEVGEESEREGNANLIASAPEMAAELAQLRETNKELLAALRKALAKDGDFVGWEKAARAAIAKAQAYERGA